MRSIEIHNSARSLLEVLHPSVTTKLLLAVEQISTQVGSLDPDVHVLDLDGVAPYAKGIRFRLFGDSCLLSLFAFYLDHPLVFHASQIRCDLNLLSDDAVDSAQNNFHEMVEEIEKRKNTP